MLVTGGAGFIGSHLVDAYLARGDEVLVIDNFVTGLRTNQNPRARYEELDLLDQPEVERLVVAFHPELVNHHAGQRSAPQSVADPVANAEVNIRGFLHLMEASRRAGTTRVIAASNAGVYGDGVPTPTPESTQPRPISPYGVTKLATEAYLHFYGVEYDIEWVALRYANVFGPRQNPKGETGVIAIFLEEMLGGTQPTIYGDGEQTRDYVYVDDVVAANLIVSRQGSGAYNIGTGQETSVNELFNLIQQVLGGAVIARAAPPRLGEQRRSVLDTERAKTELGWRAETPLLEGLDRTVAWYRSQPALENLEATYAHPRH